MNGALAPLPAGAVVKYGRLEHLRALLDVGALRLCPASYYADASLGAHRRDDERVRMAYRHPDGTAVRLLRRAAGTPVGAQPEISIRGNIAVRSETWDYFVWCSSQAVEPRLFVEFDADACLIVRDPGEFAKRVGWAVSTQGPFPARCVTHVTGACDRVTYYDPFDPPNALGEGLQVPWCKPLQFAYQREWRTIVELTPPPGGVLPILSLRLGPLADICEIHYVGELVSRTDRVRDRGAVSASPKVESQ